MTQYQDTQLFINGEWGPAAAGGVLPVLNPATGEQIGTLARAERADLDRALAAADQGFRVWRKTSAYDPRRSCAPPPTCCANGPNPSPG
jgi:succinate-semialdehyde dehydrogenase/glutarate-semialdehyde dehydrogenase